MGNVSILSKDELTIDLSLSNIWRSWFKFRQGKRATKELDDWQYHLEDNLWWLYLDLNKENYAHGPYQHFIIKESKRRDIAVATVRDRVAHRLVYDFLVSVYDRTFIYDAWSCRKNKGLIGAIERTQKFIKKYPASFVWRADVTKFFNNVSQNKLRQFLSSKITDKKATWLIEKIIFSYACDGQHERERERE